MSFFNILMYYRCIARVATSIEPALQPVQNAKAFVQLLLDHLSHVAVDFVSLQQLLEGLV